MQSATLDVLTIRDVAHILQCSKAHVANVILGKVQGVPRLAHMSVGRRKMIRREWLEKWMEASKQEC